MTNAILEIEAANLQNAARPVITRLSPEQIAEAETVFSLLGDRSPLVAAKFYLENYRESLKPKKVADAFKDFIADKKAANKRLLSDHYYTSSGKSSPRLIRLRTDFETGCWSGGERGGRGGFGGRHAGYQHATQHATSMRYDDKPYQCCSPPELIKTALVEAETVHLSRALGWNADIYCPPFSAVEPTDHPVSLQRTGSWAVSCPAGGQ